MPAVKRPILNILKRCNPLKRMLSVSDYQHCAETQDRRLEGSKTASTPPYILIADRYFLQITVPISVTYYPIMSYYPHLLRVYIETLELHSQSSSSFNSSPLQSLQIVLWDIPVNVIHALSTSTDLVI